MATDSEIINDLKSDLECAEIELKETQEELEQLKDAYIDPDNCDEIETGLGLISIHNRTGNLSLQQEIETFMEQLKKKYP